MKLVYLRYFNHLAKVLNFTKTAEDLYIAQPTLSAAIKKLEKDLDITLFKREKGSSNIELTESGEIYYEHVSRALNALDKGLRVAREAQNKVEGLVRVGTIYTLQNTLWSQAMQEFLEQSETPPKIIIDQGYSNQLISRLRKGEFDVAFAARMDDSEDLDYVLVWTQPLVLGVHKDSPFAKQKEITIEDLKNHEILTYKTTSPVKQIEKMLPVNDLNLLRYYDDEITMCSIVSAEEHKMAMFCHSFLADAFDGVVCRKIKGLPEDFHKVYLVTRKEKHSKAVNDYVSFMTSFHFPNVMETLHFD